MSTRTSSQANTPKQPDTCQQRTGQARVRFFPLHSITLHQRQQFDNPAIDNPSRDQTRAARNRKNDDNDQQQTTDKVSAYRWRRRIDTIYALLFTPPLSFFPLLRRQSFCVGFSSRSATTHHCPSFASHSRQSTSQTTPHHNYIRRLDDR